VDVAQLVELLVVVQAVAGSNPVVHPSTRANPTGSPKKLGSIWTQSGLGPHPETPHLVYALSAEQTFPGLGETRVSAVRVTVRREAV
jgi:hypothetical protein